MNSGLASADSGLYLGSGGSRNAVSQRRSSPCGLFSRAEDKVKLSDYEIGEACRWSATVCQHGLIPDCSGKFHLGNFRCDFEFQKRSQFLIRSQTKRFPSLRCASAIQIVRPLESTPEIQPQRQPALLRLSAMIFQNSPRVSLCLCFCLSPLFHYRQTVSGRLAQW